MTAIAHPVILPPGARATHTTLGEAVTAILEAVVIMGDWVQMGILPLEAEAVGLGPRRRTVGECLLNVRYARGEFETDESTFTTEL